LTPDDAWSKGEIRGRLRKPAATNAVEYGSALAEDRPPSDHASALADRFRPFSEQVRAVTAREGDRGVVRVVEHAGVAIGEYGIGNVEAWLGPEALETFAAMGVSLVFDAYWYANDD
jgi:hypothetical protein